MITVERCLLVGGRVGLGLASRLSHCASLVAMETRTSNPPGDVVTGRPSCPGAPIITREGGSVSSDQGRRYEDVVEGGGATVETADVADPAILSLARVSGLAELRRMVFSYSS